MKHTFLLFFCSFFAFSICAQDEQYNAASLTDTLLSKYKEALRLQPLLPTSQDIISKRAEDNSQEWLDKALTVESVPMIALGFHASTNMTLANITRLYSTGDSAVDKSEYRPDLGWGGGIYGEYFIIPPSKISNPYFLTEAADIKKALKLAPILSVKLGADYRAARYQFINYRPNFTDPDLVAEGKVYPYYETFHSLQIPVSLNLTLPLSNPNAANYKKDGNLKNYNINPSRMGKVSFWVEAGGAAQFNMFTNLRIQSFTFGNVQQDVDMTKHRNPFTAEAFGALGFRFRVSNKSPLYLKMGIQGSWMLMPFVDASRRYSMPAELLTTGYIDSDFIIQTFSFKLAFEWHKHQIRNKKMAN